MEGIKGIEGPKATEGFKSTKGESEMVKKMVERLEKDASDKINYWGE